MENNESFLIKYKKVIITIGTVVAVYLGFKFLLPLFIPFIFAYFIAWLLRPVVSFLHKRLKVPIYVGGSISLFLLIIIFSSSLFYIGRLFFNQLVMFLKNIPVYQRYIMSSVEYICLGCDKLLGLSTGTSIGLLSGGMETFLDMVQTSILPKMTLQTLKIAVGAMEVFAIIIIVLVSTLLFIKDLDEYKKGLKNSTLFVKIHSITRKLSETGTAYIKTQVIILVMIAVICTIALFILRNPYAILIGIGIGILDAFPVLGSGLVLVPWSIVMVFQRDYFAAAVLMSAFLICQLLREIIEPKLLGNKLGIRPIYSMMAMYIGVQLFGVTGFFLGPLGLVIVRTVVKLYS